MTTRVADAVRLVFGVSAMIVGKGLHTGFPIRTDSPAEVGADLIANAAAVLEKFGAPAIILDFGTATTLSVIDASRAFVGRLYPSPVSPCRFPPCGTARHSFPGLLWKTRRRCSAKTLPTVCAPG